VTDSAWAVLAILLLLDLLVYATRTSLAHVHQNGLIDLRESRPKVVERTFKLLESHSLPSALQ